MTKGELSAAVTAAVPAALSPFCRPCGVHHVGEQLLRVAGPAGGVRLRGSRPLLPEPIPGWPGPPADPAAGTTALQRTYLRFFAPSTEAEVAGFLGTSRAAAVPDRPRDLVAVRVGERAAAAPAETVDEMRVATRGWCCAASTSWGSGGRASRAAHCGSTCGGRARGATSGRRRSGWPSSAGQRGSSWSAGCDRALGPPRDRAGYLAGLAATEHRGARPLPTARPATPGCCTRPGPRTRRPRTPDVRP